MIERCYWPLLSLATDLGIPLGIEASGVTLEAIRRIDPRWLERLRKLTQAGSCEFIGSGYAQLIGPLVPESVNRWNLRLGRERYEALLGTAPKLAFVNEQAWSAGLVPIYREAGFEGLVMEWNNAARAHPQWPDDWRYHPQLALGPRGETVPILWNDSIAFQRLQRMAHGELDPDELIDWLASHGGQRRSVPLYGNDVEIFGFRPKRFAVEPTLENGEWQRLRELFECIQSDDRFRWVTPGEALSFAATEHVDQSLRLETPEQPCPVKKQPKYNLSRWAVTGRDDLEINSSCFRIAQALERSPNAAETDWQELCELWGSDYRTHITEQRWQGYLDRLGRFRKRICEPANPSSMTQAPRPSNQPDSRWDRKGALLRFESDRLRVHFNIRRGLAIDAIWWKDVSSQPLVGTLRHGFFEDISWASDFYSGHAVYQSPGAHQITDLSPIEPFLEKDERGRAGLTGTLPTALGPIEKHWLIDLEKASIRLSHRFFWPRPCMGSLRLGHVTLLPGAFDRSELFYSTCLGGGPERFELGKAGFDHGRAVSSLVSSGGVLGMTEGWMELGDREKSVRIERDPAMSACAGLICFEPIGESFFLRASLSAREFDDTAHPASNDGLICQLTLSAQRRC
ncbi:MAG: glycoside hydrolase family 57 [bacterium]|nr:glycoside hydrolase family 57 [bacterium]